MDGLDARRFFTKAWSFSGVLRACTKIPPMCSNTRVFCSHPYLGFTGTHAEHQLWRLYEECGATHPILEKCSGASKGGAGAPTVLACRVQHRYWPLAPSHSGYKSTRMVVHREPYLGSPFKPDDSLIVPSSSSPSYSAKYRVTFHGFEIFKHRISRQDLDRYVRFGLSVPNQRFGVRRPDRVLSHVSPGPYPTPMSCVVFLFATMTPITLNFVFRGPVASTLTHSQH